MDETLLASAVLTADAVKGGRVSALEVTDHALGAIRARDPQLHAFLTVDEEQIRARARAVDERRARGEALGPLAGVPVALKDAICTRGTRTTAGSRILEDWVPPYDATVVTRLEAAGAVVCGKTNLDELAMGSSTESSAFGVTRNPVDPSRTPGGSSGGSAVAVAAGMTPVSLGSDTGGSVRQPAAFTGTLAIKPTYGRVSRYGLVAFASSLDQIAPFARDERSLARVLAVIAGKDARDATTLDADIADYEAACEQDVRGLRIGVPAEYFGEGLEADVGDAVQASLARLERRGAVLVPISLPHTRHAVATYYVLATAEASSNLARFDGVRFGLRVEGEARSGTNALHAMYGRTRDAGFGREVKRRILLGTFVLSSGYYDAYYAKAQKVRALVRRDFDEAFQQVDVIAAPTAPTGAFRLGEKTKDPLAMYLSDVYTLPASLAGVPASSVPCGSTRAGLPVGLQLLAPHLAEARLFTAMAAVMREPS